MIMMKLLHQALLPLALAAAASSNNVSAASVDRSLRGVVNEEISDTQLPHVVAVDVKAERQLGKPDKSGGGGGGGSGGGGGGGKGKNKETAAATTTEATANAETVTTTVATAKPPPASVCEVNGVCSDEGSRCTIGTESCCGQTHDSIVCTCMSGQYLCHYTDACMVPSCCMSGPPSGEPVEGFCNVGEMCDTGVAGDYCCYDTTGATSGSFCSETGGGAAEPVRLR